VNTETIKLLRKIQTRKARIGVIGLGYVGLPLVKTFLQKGFDVTGFDVDAKKVDMLNRGRTYIRHISTAELKGFLSRKAFRATADFSRLKDADAILICVPTPLDGHGAPDLSYVLNSTITVAEHIRKGQLVVLESTTYPGTTDEEMLPILEAGGLKGGRDFFLAFSPEREDPGNKEFSTATTPKVVGGLTPDCLKLAKALYDQIIVRTVPVSSTKAAESTKLLENIFRSVNIALVNELKMTFDRMGIDVWEVIEAAKTKPFGFTPFYPGPGLGGHCIPLDPFYLSWKAAEFGMWTRFIELAGEINTHMPQYVVDKTVRALNEDGRSISGAKVLVLGLSYKPDIDDDRESPSYEIIELLEHAGASVAYCDPYFPNARPGRKHKLEMSSIPCTAEAFGGYDAVVLSTDHRPFRSPSLYANVRLLVDTRNAVHLPPDSTTRLVKA
jgi:UDP-N-acetyl-D-glucosamine dehydrogenase